MKLQIHAAAAFLVLSAAAFVPAADAAKPQPPAEPSARSYVQPLDLPALADRYRALPDRSKAIVNLYLEGAQRYVLTPADGAFPVPPRSMERFRSLAERGHGAAVLAALATGWPDELRERCRRESVEFVREFTAGFRKDHNLGNTWQSSWWTAEMATAAWFVWDRLDPIVQQDVADMVVYHADLIASKQPGHRINLDTEAETVAWNSTILALAPNMMPKHPHAAKWQEAARRYVYTIFATPHDLTDATPGDDGKPVKDWVVGANIHEDFSLENHNRFHIDYEFACYRFIYYGAAMYRLAGQPLPAAYRHHTRDVYEKVMLPCTDGEKFVVYVSDCDWRRYHAWTESSAVDGYIALTESSPLAAKLEEQSLRASDAYWRAFPPNFSYANPYVCGKAWTPRIADIVLLHLLLPPAPEPVSAAKVEEQLRGVTLKPDVNLLTQYSREGSFRSFYWGPGPTVRHVEPRDKAWMMLPLSVDYGVAIDGKPEPDGAPGRKLGEFTFRKGPDWFWAMRRDARGVNDAFVSLPGEMVVALATVPASALKGAKTVDVMAAVEKPHEKFAVYYQDGQATYRYGQDAWTVQGQWVNLADCMGYVALTLSADPSSIVLPRPGVRDFLHLHHVEKPVHDQCFVTVALPNRGHKDTEAVAAQVSANLHDGVLSCRVPGYSVCANFSDRAAGISLPAGPATCPPHSVVILGMNGEGKTWSELK